MTIKRALAPGLFMMASTFAFGVGPDVYTSGASATLTAFATVTGGEFDNLPATHFCVFDATNTNVTHMVISGLEPVAYDVNIVGGDYTLVNIANGDELGSGAIAFEVAAAANTSPIVGIIPMPGGWDSSTLTKTTPTSILGGKTATVTYSPTAGAMTLDIDGTASALNYVASAEDAIHIEAPFWISSGTDSIKFVEGFVDVIDSSNVKGLVVTDFSGTIADSIYMITVSDTVDSDSDTVTDLLDANNYWYSGSEFDNDTGFNESPWFGNFWFCYSPRYDDAWNNFTVENHAYFWHNQHGYMYGEAYTGTDSTRWAFFYDYNLGWLATNESVYPYMYAYDANVSGTDYGATWLYFVDNSGYTSSRFFYAFDGMMSQSSSFGTQEDYKGWWAIPGAYN